MKQSHWITRALALALALALSACGSPEREPETEGKPASSSRASSQAKEQEEEKEEKAPPAEFAPGEWEGDVFTSASDGLRFILPEGWVAASDEDILRVMDIALEDEEIFNDKGKRLYEMTKEAVVYEMIVSDPETGCNVIITNENLRKTSPLFSPSEEEYAKLMIKNSDKTTNIKSVWGEPYREEVAGMSFLVVPASPENTELKQLYYIHKMEDRVTGVCVTYRADGSGLPPEEIIAHFSSPSDPMPERKSKVKSTKAGAQEADGETQRAGAEGLGYVDIPADWGRFRDLDGGTDLQYSDPTGKNIVTMNTIDFSTLTEEEASLLNVDTAAMSIWSSIEARGGKDIQGARVKLGEYDANQIYAYFEDGIILVAWIFQSADGEYHYLAAEGPADTVADVVNIVEETYALEA